MNKEELNLELQSIKKAILDNGIPIPGTIHKLYARCGSKTCPCANDDSKRHGPYYRWHYRMGNRQCTIGIDIKNIETIQNAINNREKLEALIEKLFSTGIQYIEGELNSSLNMSISDKSKKS
jgi:hypothetical protein